MKPDRMRDRARHLSLASGDVFGPWTLPAPRRVSENFGGCDCSLGLAVCTCAPMTQPAVHEPLFDKSPGASRVIGFALAIGAIAGLAAAFLPYSP